MGEARRRLNSFTEIRSGRFTCVYCGDRAFTVDHVPPRSVFNGNRPRGLEFPSCVRCNDATRELDVIVGWLAQIGSWTDPTNKDRVSSMTRRVKRDFPEFSTSFRRVSPLTTFTPTGLVVPPKIVELSVDKYFHAVVTQFGLKFALAMHWLDTGDIASEDHRVVVFSLPNQDARPGTLPHEIYGYFSQQHHLVQGRKDSKGVFSYSSGSTSDNSISGQMTTVGSAFSAVSFVVAPSLTHQISHDSFPLAQVFGRKQILKRYPFGLPRLNEQEIILRGTIMNL